MRLRLSSFHDLRIFALLIPSIFIFVRKRTAASSLLPETATIFVALDSPGALHFVRCCIQLDASGNPLHVGTCSP